MNGELHFEMQHDDIVKQNSLTVVHLSIDIGRHAFYREYFDNICRQIKLLLALNERPKAVELCNKEKRDMAAAIQVAAKNGLEIKLLIPKLDECCNHNID